MNSTTPTVAEDAAFVLAMAIALLGIALNLLGLLSLTLSEIGVL